jgi:hypothetical protein
MATKATYDSTDGTFTLARGVWSGKFPITELPKWLSFYQRQKELFPNHAGSYDDDVKALEAARQLIVSK